MKKRMLPILLGIFTLFFSGKPASPKACLSSIYIANYSSAQLYYVEVYNYSTDSITTYWGPYQNVYEGTGIRFRVTFHFVSNFNGFLQVDSNLPDPRSGSTVYIEFESNCENHQVWAGE